jgi:hypothetical protein
MKWYPGFFLFGLVLLNSPSGWAQSVGRVDCARAGGYVYLYSSMTTLDVRTTLQCGEEVQVTGRYDKYFGVRTAKGEIGYVPLNSLVLYKDADKKAPAAPGAPARERTPYDAVPPTPEAPPAPPPTTDLILPNGVQIRLRLSKTISSSAAKLGDHVDFEVAEDVVIDGVRVVAKGAPALGTVSEAEAKKRLGHGGTLGITLNSVQLTDNEKAAVRGYQETRGSNSSAPMLSGKDVAFVQGTEFTALVDGDLHLKRESFLAAKQGTEPSQARSQN